jgi:hypothetical protein
LADLLKRPVTQLRFDNDLTKRSSVGRISEATAGVERHQ